MSRGLDINHSHADGSLSPPEEPEPEWKGLSRAGELRLLNAAQTLRARPGRGTNQGFRDQAALAVLLGSGLRVSEVADPKNRALFEPTRSTPFTPRCVQQIVKHYREEAGITQPVHPPLFRHQMLTYLTTRGLSDRQLQLLSGHDSKKSLELYQHLSLENVEHVYQEAVNPLEVSPLPFPLPLVTASLYLGLLGGSEPRGFPPFLRYFGGATAPA